MRSVGHGRLCNYVHSVSDPLHFDVDPDPTRPKKFQFFLFFSVKDIILKTAYFWSSMSLLFKFIKQQGRSTSSGSVTGDNI